MEQFKGDAGFDAVIAHYRGIGPAINDLLGGQIDDDDAGPRRRAAAHPPKKMKPIAVTGLQRHPLLPEVPTFEESGFKGFDGVQWYGIVGPAKLPRRDHAAAQRRDQQGARLAGAAAAPGRREAIEPMPMTPEQFGAFIQPDIARWSALARERNIKLDD